VHPLDAADEDDEQAAAFEQVAQWDFFRTARACPSEEHCASITVKITNTYWKHICAQPAGSELYECYKFLVGRYYKLGVTILHATAEREELKYPLWKKQVDAEVDPESEEAQCYIVAYQEGWYFANTPNPDDLPLWNSNEGTVKVYGFSYFQYPRNPEPNSVVTFCSWYPKFLHVPARLKLTNVGFEIKDTLEHADLAYEVERSWNTKLKELQQQDECKTDDLGPISAEFASAGWMRWRDRTVALAYFVNTQQVELAEDYVKELCNASSFATQLKRLISFSLAAISAGLHYAHVAPWGGALKLEPAVDHVRCAIPYKINFYDFDFEIPY
jgi:hypothetical protein